MKITILALMAGVIISAGGASAQGVYLDFGNNPGPRYRDYDDGPRYPDRDRRILIGLADTRPSTDAKTVGRCKTVSASRTAATETRPVLLIEADSFDIDSALFGRSIGSGSSGSRSAVCNR